MNKKYKKSSDYTFTSKFDDENEHKDRRKGRSSSFEDADSRGENRNRERAGRSGNRFRKHGNAPDGPPNFGNADNNNRNENGSRREKDRPRAPVAKYGDNEELLDSQMVNHDDQFEGAMDSRFHQDSRNFRDDRQYYESRHPRMLDIDHEMHFNPRMPGNFEPFDERFPYGPPIDRPVMYGEPIPGEPMPDPRSREMFRMPFEPRMPMPPDMYGEHAEFGMSPGMMDQRMFDEQVDPAMIGQGRHEEVRDFRLLSEVGNFHPGFEEDHERIPFDGDRDHGFDEGQDPRGFPEPRVSRRRDARKNRGNPRGPVQEIRDPRLRGENEESRDLHQYGGEAREQNQDLEAVDNEFRGINHEDENIRGDAPSRRQHGRFRGAPNKPHNPRSDHGNWNEHEPRRRGRGRRRGGNRNEMSDDHPHWQMPPAPPDEEWYGEMDNVRGGMSGRPHFRHRPYRGRGHQRR